MATGQATILSDRLLSGMLGQMPMPMRDDERLPKRLPEGGLLNLQRPCREPESNPTQKISVHVTDATDLTNVIKAASAVDTLSIVEKLLLSNQHVSTRLQTSRPGFPKPAVGALSKNSQRIIGEHGVRRFEEFKQYSDGWDYGRGRALSPRSVATFEVFLRQLPELAVVEPSLFLTTEGNIQLGWEDRDGGIVEVDFLPDGFEYYVDSTGEEGTMGLAALREIVERIRRTIP